jgi:hypothetical protein
MNLSSNHQNALLLIERGIQTSLVLGNNGIHDKTLLSLEDNGFIKFNWAAKFIDYELTFKGRMAISIIKYRRKEMNVDEKC